MLESRCQLPLLAEALRRGAIASVLLAALWIAAEGLQQLYADMPVWSEDALAFAIVLGLLGLPVLAVEEGACLRGRWARLGLWLAALVLVPLAVLGASVQATFSGELLRGAPTSEATRVVVGRLAFSGSHLPLELPLALRWAAPLLATLALRLAGARLLPQLIISTAAAVLGLVLHVDLVHRAVDPLWTADALTWSAALSGPLAASVLAGIGVPICVRAAEGVESRWSAQRAAPQLRVQGTRKCTARDHVEKGLAVVYPHRRLASRLVLVGLVALFVWGTAEREPVLPVEPEHASPRDLARGLEATTASSEARGWAKQALESQKSGDHHLAFAQAGWALDADPDYEWAYLIRAAALSEQGMSDASRAVCDRLVALRPGSLWGYLARAAVCERQGDYEGAALDYTYAIELFPQERWLYWHRSVARKSVGDLAGAALDNAVASQEFPHLDHSPLWLMDSQ